MLQRVCTRIGRIHEFRKLEKTWIGQKRWFGSQVSDRDAALAFVRERGFKYSIADGVIRTLENPSSGIGKGKLLETVKMLAGRYEIGEDAGLQALANAVQNEVRQREGKQSVVVHFSAPDGTKFDVTALEGMTIYDIVEGGNGKGAEILQEMMECACSGKMACSTCQVIVDDEWFPVVGPPCEAEQDMLDLAYDPQPTSRLGCQILLTPKLQNLVLRVPSSSNNLMDFIPFEDKR